MSDKVTAVYVRLPSTMLRWVVNEAARNGVAPKAGPAVRWALTQFVRDLRRDHADAKR